MLKNHPKDLREKLFGELPNYGLDSVLTASESEGGVGIHAPDESADLSLHAERTLMFRSESFSRIILHAIHRANDLVPGRSFPLFSAELRAPRGDDRTAREALEAVVAGEASLQHAHPYFIHEVTDLGRTLIRAHQPTIGYDEVFGREWRKTNPVADSLVTMPLGALTGSGVPGEGVHPSLLATANMYRRI